MAAIKLRWPTALVQFEDFQSKHAIKLLMRYKKEYLMFNDDIQVELRINILKIQEKPKNNDLQTLQIMISKHYCKTKSNQQIMICRAQLPQSSLASTEP